MSPILFACACAFVFGLGPFLYRRMLTEMSVSQMLLLVSTMFCVTSLLFWLYSTGGKWECTSDGVLSMGVLAGAGVFFAGYYLFFTALNYPNANTAVVAAITHASVVVTLFVSWLVFKESLTKLQTLGILLIVVGCVLTAMSS